MTPNLSQLLVLFRLSLDRWIADRAASMGAAIAYYTVLSLAPLLLIVTAIAGLFYGRQAAQGALISQLSDLIGDSGAQEIQTILVSTQDFKGGVVSLGAGIILLVVGSTTVFAELRSDLNIIWQAPPETGNGLWNFVKTRLLSFGVILGTGFLLIVSLVASAAISVVSTIWGGLFGAKELMLHALNFVVSLVIISGLFALIYRMLPRVSIRWNDVWIGAVFTALMFSLGKFAIGLYLGHSAVSSTYGAVGAFVVLIVWVYYAAQIFLFGAEFTYQISLFQKERHARRGGASSQPTASLIGRR